MHQKNDDKEEFWLIGPVFTCTMTDMYEEDEDEDDYPVIVEPPKYGYHCEKCGDYFPHAESNQKDGTLICYSCRNFG